MLASQAHDRQTAKMKLREARTALNNRQFEQAEAIALDVKGWGFSYGMFEDSPDKIAAAARALRRRDKIRNAPSKDQSSQGVYDILVEESRQLMLAGKFDEAEAKARQAQRMNVVPALTADRAESVLHEIAMAKAQKEPVAAAPKAGAEPSRFKLEREANELLAKGDQAAAQARFAEAERLDPSTPSPAAAAQPAVELAVGKLEGGNPAASPGSDRTRGQSSSRAAAAGSDHSGHGRSHDGRARGTRTTRLRPPRAGPPRRIGASNSLRRPKSCTRTAITKRPGSSPTKPRAGKFGVEAQSDELLAQIAMTEQGGALSLYESALAAMRSGDNGRAKALLTEVAAAGDSLNEGLRTKVTDLLQKLSTDGKAKPDAKSGYDGRLRTPRRSRPRG